MQLSMSNSYTEAEATTIFDIAVQLTPVAIHGNGPGAALSPLRTKIATRIHSSGMRTESLLTISQHPLHTGCVSEHALGRGVCIPACTGHGVSTQRVYLPGERTCPGGEPGRGCTWPGVHLARGDVPASGCTCLGMYLSVGCVSRHAMGQTPPVDRKTPLKT